MLLVRFHFLLKRRNMKTLRITIVSYFLAVFFLISACGPKDREVQAAVESVISGTGCTGISSKVEGGVVTLTGDCKNRQDILAMEEQIKAVHGVKKIVNNVKLADPELPTPTAQPGTITISNSDTLTAGVREIMKDYPKVQATVSDSVILLSGEINKEENKKLIQRLHALKPKSVDNKKLLVK
jgi:hyperosmotically inducible protein